MRASRRAEQLRIAARLRLTLRERARARRLPPAGRAAWQAQRLAELRRHAVSRSPLYRELHHGLDGAPLGRLPTVGKADVVERFDELVTDRRLRGLSGSAGALSRASGRWRVAASSGSSGRPGLFVFDEGEWVTLLAAAAEGRAIAGRPPVEGRMRSARIGSPSDAHLSRQLPSTLRDPRKPSLTLSAADGVNALVEPLERWRPHVLSGYASVLAALAAAQRAGRLTIEPLQVFSGGERLSSGARELVRAAWGVEPFDQYQTTEAGFVAIDCPEHTGLHVLDDHVVVEVVDGDDRPVPAGVTGDHVLLTVLASRTLPLIRYRLDDVVVAAEGPCSCGRSGPRLRSISSGGRELIGLPGRGGQVVEVHPVAMTSVLDPAPLAGYQVVHHADEVDVLVVPAGDGLDERDLAQQLQVALDRAGAAVHVRVLRVDALQRSTSGKAGLVVSRRMGTGTGPA